MVSAISSGNIVFLKNIPLRKQNLATSGLVNTQSKNLIGNLCAEKILFAKKYHIE